MAKKLESSSTYSKAAIPEVKPRCAWSGETSKKLKSLDDLELTAKGQEVHLYAVPEYEAKVRAFVNYYKRFRQLFQALITAGIAGIFLTMFGGMGWLEPFTWLFVGIVLLIFPFAHSQTFQGMTLRSSTHLARGVAVGCFVMAVFLFL
jgi:uncharacterized membrane protein YjjP (DUF1212 family)